MRLVLTLFPPMTGYLLVFPVELENFCEFFQYALASSFPAQHDDLKFCYFLFASSYCKDKEIIM